MGRIVRVLVVVVMASPRGSAANISGVVKDVSGKPIEDARVDHIGKPVVAAPAAVKLKPSADEVRTDTEGRFRVNTNVRAIVIRKPGYESRRIQIIGDAQVAVKLERIQSTSRCKLSPPPVFKTQETTDVDYKGKWFYIETKDGREGIVSGHGSMYSFGAPADDKVWSSVEYREIMFDDGVIDAVGLSADGRYWRFRGIFGAAARYDTRSREVAERLDCVMDQISVTDSSVRR